MPQTIQQTIEELHSALRDYIEATYHISSPALIEQRKELLNRAGVIFQDPYIESTPRYQTGEGEGTSPWVGQHHLIRAKPRGHVVPPLSCPAPSSLAGSVGPKCKDHACE